NHMGDHGVVDRICIFGDVEILLDGAPRVGEERLVGADAAAIFIRLSDIVGANSDKPAIGNLKLTMELNKPFSLPAGFRTETSAAEDENHWMLSLQFRELPSLGGLCLGYRMPAACPHQVRKPGGAYRCRAAGWGMPKRDFRSVVGKLIIGEDSPWNNVR